MNCRWEWCGFTPEPDQINGEFAILVRSDLRRQWDLGPPSMHRIIEVAAATAGCSGIIGSVLRDNTRMLRLVRELGFVAENTRAAMR